MKLFTSIDKARTEQVKIGDQAPDFGFVDFLGKKRRLSHFRGKRVLLSFYRFAASPVCAYNADQLQKRASVFEKAGVVTLSVFKSTPQNIAKFYREASECKGCYALTDAKGSVFRRYSAKKSTGAIGRVIGLLGNYRRYKTVIDVSAAPNNMSYASNTNQTRQLPADFLINEAGTIVDVFWAENMSDHMPFERLDAFIPEGRRCRCYKRDCTVPRCRETYEEIMRQSRDMLYVGEYVLRTDPESCEQVRF